MLWCLTNAHTCQHEEICRFPSKEFYEAKHIRLTQCIIFQYFLACNFYVGSPQVRVAGLLIKQSRVEPEHIAILTPYNAQVSEIKNILKKRHLANVSVCTIMKSQGSEWPYVILSAVRSCSDIESDRPSKAWLGKRLGFITDPNQVNVAITRAQDGLVILGNSNLLKRCELWKRLLDHYYKEHCVVDPASDIKVQNRMSAGHICKNS
uniref:DNA2/NAM7 helicase-like C-terminal domain-containing protein n=1 Tax=Sinocyclocheilus grahami TaxID=75366 RepID=A0A672NLL5_SINGR